MPTAKEVCAMYGLKDVSIDYKEAKYQNLSSYYIFQRNVRPILVKENPKIPVGMITMLVVAKWREFQNENSSRLELQKNEESPKKQKYVAQPDRIFAVKESNFLNNGNNSNNSNNYSNWKSKSNSNLKSAPISVPTPPSSSIPVADSSMPNVKEVCAMYGLKDVKIDYNEAKYQNLASSYMIYQEYVCPIVVKENPKEPVGKIMMLVAAKWLEFMNQNPSIKLQKEEELSDIPKPTAEGHVNANLFYKKQTSYIGLKNQGIASSLNSLLQTLYFINQFREAVYRMPLESFNSTESVALALQKVFLNLQSSNTPVGNEELPRLCGWEALNLCMHHNVQEFLQVILNRLDNEMKGTCVEGHVSKLFEGKMNSFIKCRSIAYESVRLETFHSIQLNVRGKHNIIESFQDYVTTDILDGDNKYHAGVYGFQEAVKGVIFESFPPVLHLQLMRFQYNPITDGCVKLNDRFEFYEKLDLNPYLERSIYIGAEYTLYAVLVHKGDHHGGHHVAFINPEGDGKWWKFEDSIVSPCTKKEAIDCNYGEPNEELGPSAYMLVYICDSERENIFKEVTTLPFLKMANQNAIIHSQDVHVDDDESNCVICLSEKRQIACNPCGHMCLCELCLPAFKQKYTECPICQEVYHNTLKIYV